MKYSITNPEKFSKGFYIFFVGSCLFLGFIVFFAAVNSNNSSVSSSNQRSSRTDYRLSKEESNICAVAKKDNVGLWEFSHFLDRTKSLPVEQATEEIQSMMNNPEEAEWVTSLSEYSQHRGYILGSDEMKQAVMAIPCQGLPD